MEVSLKVKLSAAFLAVTLLFFLVAGILTHGMVERRFTAYIIGRQDQAIEGIASALSAGYGKRGRHWDVSAIESVGMQALGNGLILRVEDVGGVAVWDARAHNGGMCDALLEDVAEAMHGYSAGFDGGYTEKRIALAADGDPAGTLVIGYYGPYTFSDGEIRFLSSLNRLLVRTAMLAALAALGFGVLMAGHLARPIEAVIHAAGRIASGDYASRVREPSTTREIVSLAETVNRLAETLGQQDRLRKRLTADVAHELRTPLATMQSHIEAMIDGVWQPDAARLKSLHEETLRLVKLVGDLGKLTEYEGESLALDKRRIDLSALLRRIAMNFEGPYRKAGVSLSVDCAHIWIIADADKLSQVFVNLLSNALNYTPAGGAVTVRARQRAGRAEVDVADTGIGIDEEDLPHVFERFYRTDRSRSRLTGGAGIGLAIARSVAEAHGGAISVISRPGAGSVFTVELPIS